MAKTKHTCIQGASYSYDYWTPDYETLDDDWTGKWAIVDLLGTSNTELATGSLSKNTDNTKFQLRILPADTNTIPPGDYVLVVEITNIALGFSNEVAQDKFTITPQGV